MSPCLKPLIFSLIWLFPVAARAQAYTPVKTNWQDAGYRGGKPLFSQTKNILDFGADNSGILPCNNAFANAVSALKGAPGIIFFPTGNYSFNAGLIINRDSLIIRGAGYDSTGLHFNLSGSLNSLINITGVANTDTSSLTTAANRGSFTVNVFNAAAFHADDWLSLSMNDQAFMVSSWAFGSLSQLMQVKSVNGSSLTFKSPFRFSYSLANRPVFRKMTPRNNIGIECLKIQRMDATAGQSSNIVVDKSVNCWVKGIESDSANFAHVEIDNSSNIEVTNDYFHDAFAYGGNGQGYGVLLQFGSNECLVAANYFKHLRHSMILQAGANGNVVAYNYSLKPFWTEPSLPDSSAGDIVLHGNYPFMNLLEGNFVQNIVIDDSHGKNGPFNTFFRNRAAGYGVFMNFNPATDSVQFIGNEITNSQIGLDFINGMGHFLYGNNYRGTIVDGTANIPDTSLYLSAGQKPSCPQGYDAWPVAGRPGAFNLGTIYAKARVMFGRLAACACVDIPSATAVTGKPETSDCLIFPNPARHHIALKGAFAVPVRVDIYNMKGELVLERKSYVRGESISVEYLTPGVYMTRITAKGRVFVRRFLKN